MASRLQVIQATPGLDAVRTVLARLPHGESCFLTALSGSRMAALRTLAETTEFEISEFGQVVGQVLSRLGGHPVGLPTQGHLRAALAQACEDLPDDSPFKATAMTPGFQRYAGRLLDDLRAYGIEAEELLQAMPHAPEDLAPKLRDLARLQQSIADAMAKLGKRFNRERMEACYEFDDAPPLDIDLLVWIGSDDAPLALDWLKWVANHGARVTAITEYHPTNPHLFEGGRSAVAALGESAKPLPLTNELAAKLFAEADFTGTARPLAVEITIAPDQLAEVEWTVRTILAEIAAGTAPSKIAIVTRGLSDYAPLLESAAKRLGLPLQCGRSVPLMANGMVRFLVELLRALGSRDVRSLLPLLRSSYLRMPRRAIGELESVISEAHRVRSDPWGALAEALRSEIAAESAEWLLPVLEWRTEARKESRKLDEWADLIRDLGDQAWLAKALETQTPTQDRDVYAQNAMQRALADTATMERLDGGRTRNYDAFLREAVRLWQNSEVIVPQDPEGVTVVSAGESLGDVEFVAVLGMLEGVFPRRRSENPILHDEDLLWLGTHLGVELPNSHRRAREERDEFYRVICAPTRRLVLSYPQTGEDRDNVPAFYLQEAQRIMNAPEHRFSRTEFAPPTSALDVDVRLREALAGPRKPPTPLRVDSDEARDAIRRGPDEPYSVRELVNVLQCPFRYVASSRLRINTPRRSSRWNRLLNLPQVAGLAGIADEQTATRRLHEELDNMLTDLYSESTAADLALMKAGGKRLIKEWVDREFTARAKWPRDGYVTHAVQFDDEHLKASLKLANGETLRFRGEFPAMTEQRGYRVLHLFRHDDPVPPKTSTIQGMSEEDRLEIGLAMLMIRPKDGPSAVEIDCATTGVRRKLYRQRNVVFAQDTESLKAMSIDENEFATLKSEVVVQLETATQRITQGSVEARPGDGCRHCEYGELCRRAQGFSDERDPFDFKEDAVDE